MHIVLIPDEYTQDPATGFEIGLRWGVQSFEIRHVYRWRVPVSPGWVGDRLVQAVRDYGVNIAGLSPGLFKPTMRLDGSTVPLGVDTPEEIRRHLDELLPEMFLLAERLGTRNVTVFALPRGGAAEGSEIPPIVIDTLGQAADRADHAGFQLLLENGAGTWATGGDSIAAILSGVGRDSLALTWDPANCVMAGVSDDPVASDYPKVRSWVRNVHVKDAEPCDVGYAWCPLGQGVVDWRGQFRALAADGYDGPVTAESHLQFSAGRSVNLVEANQAFLQTLETLVQSVND